MTGLTERILTRYSIRSFSNRTAEVIQFFTPLTLIVGLNGSGKTTIIECLKYATTGELPAGAKQGGAWIHDPKLCGEKEVLAAVRLSFISTKGHRMVLARNLQLTVTRTTRSMKALESSLSRRDQNGEKLVLSSKVAEMDTLVPDFLGVSRAVLDNVIFCHQEDSLWPMAVPAELKKKFDDIFEAVKYTQAVDNIKKLRKEYAEKLKTMKVIEQHAKEYKDRGAKLERDSHALSTELDELRAEGNRLIEVTNDAEAHFQECLAKVTHLSTLAGNLHGKRIMLQAKEENVARLQRSMTVLPDTDEELEQKLDNFEERVSVLEKNRDAQRRRFQELTTQTQKTRSSLSIKDRELGTLEGQQAEHERRVEAREQLVKQLARQHSIRGFDLDLDNDHIAAFKERLQRLKREQDQKLVGVRNQINEELQKAHAGLSSIHERKTSLGQRKESARSAIAANDKKISDAQIEHDGIEVDEGAKAAVESSIVEISDKLDRARSNTSSADRDRKIEELSKQSSELETLKETLNAELIESTKRAGEAAQLDFIHKELKDRQRSLETMKSTHGEQLTKLIGADWVVDSLEHDFQAVLSLKNEKVAEATRQRDGVNNELDQVNFKLKTCRAALKRRTLDLRELSQAIKKDLEIEPDEFTDRLNQLEQDGDVVSNNQSATDAMAEYFKSSIDTAKKHSSCRLCQRSFDKQDKHLQEFLKRLQKNFDNLKKGDRKDEEELLEELRIARSLLPTYESWKKLQDVTIPELQLEEKQLVDQHETLTSTLEQQDTAVRDRKEEYTDVERQSKTVQNMLKYHTDQHSMRQQISELQAKQANAQHFRSLDQIQDEIKAANEQSRTAKASSDKLVAERERARNIFSALEFELRDAHSKLEKTTFMLKERLSFQKQISEMKAANAEHRQIITEIDQEMQGLGPALGQAQAAHDEAQRQGNDRDRQARNEIANVESSINQVQLASQQIEDYLARDPAAQVHRTRFAIESMQKEIEQIGLECQQITKEVNGIENQLANNAEVKRSISDNLDYRRDSRDVEQMRSEISELETHNVESEGRRWNQQRMHWESERMKASAAQAQIVGQLQEKDSRLSQYLEDWETDYKDAAYKFKEAHIRVETTKAAVEDLGRYGGALENAVMKYHNLKMEEVNRIIDELWRRTYMGTDVDTILIKSENENLKGGKSYKYRVCMIKQDVEMDMRGRCSAGQKVLASIIIRLALAECFGTNCGLIALDEPTTNLDRDNIEALARALSDIIRVRREQSNFQLIVITHDEEFLKYMQCSDYTDSYYRVSRSAMQKTEIHKQSIGQVMA